MWSDTVFLCYLPLVFEALLVVSCAECRWEIPAAGGQGPSEGSARGRWCHRRGGYSEAEVLSYDTETNRFTGESWRLFTKGDRAEFQMSENIQIWLVVWNMFFPYIGNNNANCLSFFFRGVGIPPASNFLQMSCQLSSWGLVITTFEVDGISFLEVSRVRPPSCVGTLAQSLAKASWKCSSSYKFPQKTRKSTSTPIFPRR